MAFASYSGACNPPQWRAAVAFAHHSTGTVRASSHPDHRLPLTSDRGDHSPRGWLTLSGFWTANGGDHDVGTGE